MDAVRDMILLRHRIGLKQVSEALNILNERVLHIVHVDLGMRQISIKWTLRYQNIEQKRAKIDLRSICHRIEIYTVFKPRFCHK